MMNHSKVFENSGWLVVFDEETQQYCVASPKGETCICFRVRILSPESFVIEHPVATSLTVDVRDRKELPYVFRGDLEKTKGKMITHLRKCVGLHLGGKLTRGRRRNSTIQD